MIAQRHAAPFRVHDPPDPPSHVGRQAHDGGTDQGGYGSSGDQAALHVGHAHGVLLAAEPAGGSGIVPLLELLGGGGGVCPGEGCHTRYIILVT